MTLSYDDIIITGRGVVSSLGNDIQSFEEAIFSGKCGLIEKSDLLEKTSFQTVAAVQGIEKSHFFNLRLHARIDRFAQFAAIASAQACLEADLDHSDTPRERIGIVIGSANGGIDAFCRNSRRIYAENRRPEPLAIPLIMGSSPASFIARQIGAKGPVYGLTSACASASHAIINAVNLIRMGVADIVITGGTDSCMAEPYLMAWDALGIVSQKGCRPFAADRDGLTIGEGAGIFILERLKTAEKRTVRPIAKIVGAGLSSDAGGLLAPDSGGMSTAMQNALFDAHLSPADIDYINAHGTGTKSNDTNESAAIREVFGGSADVAVSSTKSMHGHAMGASGAIELLAAIAAIRKSAIPPTVNTKKLDAKCELNIITTTQKRQPVKTVMSNSFAFGGLNATLIAEKIT